MLSVNTGGREDWDDEIDDNARTFSFEVRKAMPLGIVPQAASPVKDQYAFDVQQAEYEYGEEAYGEEEAETYNIKELIPEKPDNW